MSDLVKRLRFMARDAEAFEHDLTVEAADEIEKLQARLDAVEAGQRALFATWWHEVGSGITVRFDDGYEEAARRVAAVAWDAAQKDKT